MESLTNKGYLRSGGDIYNIAISLMICVDSYLIWQFHGTKKTLKQLTVIILCCSLALGIVVYVQFIALADLSDYVFAYSSKNSLAQILFCAGLMGLIFLGLFKNKFIKIGVVSCVCVLLVLVFMLKSRGTIVCVFLIAAYYTLKHGTVKHRIWIAIGFLAVILYVYYNSDAHSVVVDQILLANRDAEDVNDVSSGRVEIIGNKFDVIENNLLFGIGNSYVDCMPICMILQYGLLGASMVFTFLFLLGRHIVRLPRTSILNLNTYLLFFSYILNSLFEAYPPFGPGIKCFILWMSIGFSLAYQEKIGINRQYNIL